MSLKTYRGRNYQCWVLASGLLLGAPAQAADEPASSASSANISEAESLAAQAYAAYREQRYRDAVSLYQKAFDLAPSADALFNIARVYDLGLRERDAAIAFYARYVSDPGATTQLTQRASERLTQLRASRVAQLEPRPGAAAVAPAAPAPGAGAAAGSGLLQDAGSAWSSWKIAALSSGAAGAVALGVGVSYGISLRSEAALAQRECNGNHCGSQRGVDAAHAAARDARAANWSLGLAGSLLAGATLLWLLEPGAPAAPDPAAVALTPIADASVLGALISGGW